MSGKWSVRYLRLDARVCGPFVYRLPLLRPEKQLCRLTLQRLGAARYKRSKSNCVDKHVTSHMDLLGQIEFFIILDYFNPVIRKLSVIAAARSRA